MFRSVKIPKLFLLYRDICHMYWDTVTYFSVVAMLFVELSCISNLMRFKAGWNVKLGESS